MKPKSDRCPSDQPDMLRQSRPNMLKHVAHSGENVKDKLAGLGVPKTRSHGGSTSCVTESARSSEGSVLRSLTPRSGSSLGSESTFNSG